MGKSDLFDRLGTLIETGGGLGIIALSIMLLIMLMLTVTNKRSVLLAAFMLAAPFSGAVIAFLDSSSTLFRWATMFCLSITIIYGMRWPGWPTALLGAFSVVLIAMSFTGPNIFFTAQRSVLYFILTVPMAMVVAHYFKSMAEITQFLKLFLFAGGLYALMAVATLPSLRSGERFSGIMGGAPLFVMTGGILLPFAVWGAMQAKGRFLKFYCVSIAISITLTNVLSAQRTGTIAGFIGCIPLMMRFGFKKIFTSAIVMTLCVGVLLAALTLLPGQAQFIHTRYFKGDTTGRTDIWRMGYEACMNKPFYGHGMGSAYEVTSGSLHSAYLSVWYEGGIFNLVIFIIAYSGALIMSIRPAFRGSTQEIRNIGRLLMGVLLACIAAGFVEDSFYSPSNIAGFVGVTACVAIYRLRIIERETLMEAQYEQDYGTSEEMEIDAEGAPALSYSNYR